MIREPVFEDPGSLTSLLQRAEARLAARERLPDLELALIIEKHRGKALPAAITSYLVRHFRREIRGIKGPKLQSDLVKDFRFGPAVNLYDHVLPIRAAAEAEDENLVAILEILDQPRVGIDNLLVDPVAGDASAGGFPAARPDALAVVYVLISAQRRQRLQAPHVRVVVQGVPGAVQEEPETFHGSFLLTPPKGVDSSSTGSTIPAAARGRRPVRGRLCFNRLHRRDSMRCLRSCASPFQVA